MTIFEKILAGEIPGAILYEGEHSFALLDIFPQAPGHVLVISKKAYPYWEDTPQEVLTDMTATIKLMIGRIKSKLGVEGVNVVVNDGAVAGQEIPHIHFHIIPRATGDGIRLAGSQGSYTEEEFSHFASILAQ